MTAGADAEADHLVIGPGKLGLGLAAELADNAGWRTSVVFRDDCSPKGLQHLELLARDQQYDIRYFANRPTRTINVNAIQTSYTDINTATQAAFASRQLKLVSIAVPATDKAIENAAAFLAQGLKIRVEALGPDAPVTVLTCLNHRRNGPVILANTQYECVQRFGKDDQVHSVLLKDHFPLCIVDRICSDLSITPDRSSDEGARQRLQVSAETFARLIVPAPMTSALKLLSAGSPDVVIAVEGDDPKSSLYPWQKAKYWGVNGLHLFLAAAIRCTHKSGTEVLSEYLCKDPHLEMLATLYIREVTAALPIDRLGKAVLAEYLLATVRRFKESPDPVNRLLKDLGSRSNEAIWSSKMESLESDIFKLYGQTETATADRATRRSTLSVMMSTFVDSSIGIFLDKVRERILEPAQVIQNDIGLVPVALGLATNVILTVLAEEMKKSAT